MKSFKKMFWIISALFIITGAGIFISCSNDDDEDNGSVSQPISYESMTLTLNFANDIGAKSVTVKYWDSNENTPVEDIVGTVESAVTNNTATVTLSKQYSGDWGFKFSLTVKDSSGSKVKVVVTDPWFQFTKDSTKSFNVTKYVAESKNMTINFSNLGTVAAGTVKYGSSQNDSSALTTADMVISADGASATVSISSDNCNDSGYFYIAEIKLYSDANKATEITGTDVTNDGWQNFADIKTVTVSKEDYEFPYTSGTITAEAQGYTKILPASAFKDLTIAYLTVKVSSETTGAWASLSGASTWAEATYWSNCINVEKKINTEDFLNAIKTNGLWMESNAGDFIVTVSYSETADSEENSNTESGETNIGDTNAQEATIATNTEFTMTGAWATDTVLEPSAFADYSNISKIVVSISFDSSITWGTSLKLVAGSTWINDTGSWENSVVTFTVTDSTNISDFISNGVKVGSDYNGKGYATVTVYYATTSE